MIVKINGVEIAMSPAKTAPMVVHESENFTHHPAVLQVTDWMAKLDNEMWKSLVMTTACSMILWTTTGAAPVAGGWALIRLLQQGAFWVGLAVSLWGVYEWMVGGPGWKERIIKGVLGYLLCLVLPLIFVTLRASGIGQ